ncbi:MAG: flavoprotein [Gemmataceae bacterium]
MAKVLLGATGSVAAIRVPDLYAALRREGHEVRIIATDASTYFFDPAQIAPLPAGGRNSAVVTLDQDEWPGERWRRGDPVLHIELRRWADVLLVAPLDAGTLAKFALGICDNCLSCVYRAWDRTRPIVLAPAMNTLMWQHPATLRHQEQIAADMDEVHWIGPIEKRLACDEVGMGAMAEIPEIVGALTDALVGGVAAR